MEMQWRKKATQKIKNRFGMDATELWCAANYSQWMGMLFSRARVSVCAPVLFALCSGTQSAMHNRQITSSVHTGYWILPFRHTIKFNYSLVSRFSAQKNTKKSDRGKTNNKTKQQKLRAAVLIRGECDILHSTWYRVHITLLYIVHVNWEQSTLYIHYTNWKRFCGASIQPIRARSWHIQRSLLFIANMLVFIGFVCVCVKIGYIVFEKCRKRILR